MLVGDDSFDCWFLEYCADKFVGLVTYGLIFSFDEVVDDGELLVLFETGGMGAGLFLRVRVMGFGLSGKGLQTSTKYNYFSH